MLGRGFVRKEIAHELGISVNTLKTYIDEAMEKLGAHTVAHAVALHIASHPWKCPIEVASSK